MPPERYQYRLLQVSTGETDLVGTPDKQSGDCQIFPGSKCFLKNQFILTGVVRAPGAVY